MGTLLSREYLSVVGTGLVVIVGAVVVMRTMDPHLLRTTLSEADPFLLGAAIATYSLSWPIRGRRYDDVLTAMGRHCGVGFLTATIFLSQTANLVVPARAGDGARAYLLKDRSDVPYPVGAASLAVERAFDLAAITAVGGIAFAWIFFSDRTVAVNGESNAGMAAVVVGIVTVIVWTVTIGVARSDRQFGPTLRNRIEGSRLSGVADAAVRVGASVRLVAANPRSLATIGFGSVAIWALDVSTAVLVLAALTDGFGSGGVPSGTLIAVGTLAVSVGNLAKVLPLSQGGIGLYEAAFTGVVVGIAPIGVGTALVAAILDHALKNAITLGGGALAALALNVSPSAAPDETAPSESRPPDF